MPHLPAVEAYVSYDEVYGEDLSRTELDVLLRGLSLDDCLQTIGKLSSSLAAPGANPQQLDAMVARWLPAHRERALNLIRVGRRFLFPSRLSVLARLALEVADRRPADAFGGNGAQIGRFARALLGVTSVFDVSGRFDVPDRAQVEDELARLMLRRLATRTDAPLAQQFVRYWRMLVELPRARGDILVAGEDFDARLRAAIGLSVRRYIALCFGVHTRFATWNPAAPGGWTIDQGYWANTTFSPAEVTPALEALSATPDEFVGAFAAQDAAGFDQIDDLRPFALHPLCELRPGEFLPIELDMLGSRLFGDGLYWRLHPGPQATREEQSRYGASVGRALEAHLVEIAQSVYPQPAGGAQRVFEQVRYGGDDGPDLVIIDGGRTIFIEIGGERVNALRTLFQGDLGAYDMDIQTMLVEHRVAQLDRKIRDARDGRLRFADHEPYDLGMIHPVVCLLDGFPVAPVLRERIDRAVAHAGLLQEPDLGRLEIISADELEALLGEVDHHGRSMSEMLADFARDPEVSAWPLQDFLIARYGGLARTTFLEHEWQRITPLIAAELFN